ncbi:hypothetical protein Xen7305DRAFT_00051950 [Xenococcus sp. PCC 7305]|uniref:hypothetical protein n=1 Tax=Xenococcus sp. PCC 7305 TaxID=102125 RepID=UPI0002AC8B97|nr:hypothetical protein [Xenococcus sp. PCC 7305]ELS05451.1 hypothetical protein Xen7305DRAFT_00051950 [Xenococcus sp. PCC 7305]
MDIKDRVMYEENTRRAAKKAAEELAKYSSNTNLANAASSGGLGTAVKAIGAVVLFLGAIATGQNPDC